MALVAFALTLRWIGVVALPQPTEQEAQWGRAEEAARLARRAICPALSAALPLPASPAASELVVGKLRVDPVARRS